MIKISKSSWHYKLAKKSRFFDTPKNLCQYFWAVVWGIALYVYKPILVLMWLYGAYILYTNATVLTEPGVGVSVGIFAALCIVVLILSLIIAIGFLSLLVAYGIHTILQKNNWVLGSKKCDINKKPNIAIEYIKAKKEKTCPLLTYED